MIKGQGRPSKTGHVTLIHLIYLISTYASEKSGVTMSKVKGVASKMVAEASVYPPTRRGRRPRRPFRGTTENVGILLTTSHHIVCDDTYTLGGIYFAPVPIVL